MQYSNTDKNRGAHGDSSFMLGGLPSSSENPPALAVGSVMSKSLSASAFAAIKRAVKEAVAEMREEGVLL